MFTEDCLGDVILIVSLFWSYLVPGLRIVSYV